MSENSKRLADLGFFWESRVTSDLINPMHLRYTATLDQQIDDELIAQAWERTKRVYPLIDTQVEFERDPRAYAVPDSMEQYHDDHVYLVEPTDGSSRPLRSRVPVTPGSNAVGKRPMCVSYYGSDITLSAYHAFVDGGGLTRVLSTLLYAYLALATGREEEQPIVELQEGRDPSAYYTPVAAEFLSKQAFEPTPLYTLPFFCRSFIEEEVLADSRNPRIGSVSLDADAFMRLCKQSGANPSAMIAGLLAKVVYRLNPSEKNDVVFEFTMSSRGLFGLEDSIANATGSLIAYATRDDIEHKQLDEVARKIRADVASQRSRDYYLTFQKYSYMYERRKLFKTRTVTYVGTLNIGDNNSHIVDFNMETFGLNNLYLMQLNDRFLMMLSYGNATDAYLQCFLQVFDELGIDARIVHPDHQIVPDSPEPVL